MNGTFKRIMSCKLRFPKVFSFQCKKIVTNLLQLRPTKRLGVLKGGPALVRKHRWFKGFQWESLKVKKLVAPIKPTVKAFDDLRNFDVEEEDFNENYKFKLSDVDMSWANEF